MRVLVLHNRYRALGGEERAVVDSVALLRRHGHEVELLERDSAELGRAAAARALVRGGEGESEVAARVTAFAPEVVHVHNIHPRFGWRALATARAGGARTVLHLHNFRLFCSIAVAYRDGGLCFRCRERRTWPGLALRCRGSVAESAAYAVGLYRQQPHLVSLADRCIALSDAHAARLTGLGLPEEGVRVLANFVPAAGVASRSRADAGEYALIAGRLVEEKGFDLAVTAARAAGVPLVVAGAGPDEARLRRLAAGADVRFTGWLPAAELDALRSAAAVALVPSRWEEVCPYAALDALAAGVPVLGSSLGGVPEVVGPENVVADLSVDAWARALRRLWFDPVERVARGEAGLTRARERFGEAAYLERLLAIYGDP